MNYAQQFYCFGFGTFLQLIDDLQDIDDDRKNAHMTIFSLNAGNGRLDNCASRLINFMDAVLEKNLCNGQTECATLKDFIRKNCILMALDAAGGNRKYFSRSYINKIERYFPVRFSFISRLKRDITYRAEKFKKYDIPPELVFEIPPSLSTLLFGQSD